MRVTVRAPGSCGELIQGMIEGQSFLISCPINLYSTVTVTTVPDKQNNIQVVPRFKTKAKLAAQKTLDYLGITNSSVYITIESDLPIGKGWASSTADMSASVLATALAFEKNLTSQEIAKICISIEPTDSTIFPGITMFDHVHGNKIESIGKSQNLKIIAVDFPGKVNTLHFNSRDDLNILNREKENDVIRGLELIKSGIETDNSALIGQGSTISAIAHQKILFKEHLHKLIAIAQKHRAIGVNIAHSGTVIGLIFEEGQVSTKELKRDIVSNCPRIVSLLELRMVNGGLQVVSVDRREG